MHPLNPTITRLFKRPLLVMLACLGSHSLGDTLETPCEDNVHAIVVLHTVPGSERLFESLAIEAAQSVRREPGNKLLVQLRGEKGEYRFYGVWQNLKAFRKHKEFPHTQEFALKAKPLLQHQPTVELFTPLLPNDARCVPCEAPAEELRK